MRLFKFFVSTVLMLTGQMCLGQNADFTADVTSGCSPQVVKFTSTSTGTNASTSYSWDLGNGATSTGNPTASTIYVLPGSYTVVLTITNGAVSDKETKIGYITIYGLPEVNFGASPLTGCSPFTVQFTDYSTPTSGSITNWTWDFGDGNVVAGGKALQHTYIAGGSFAPKLTVKNSYGCEKTVQKPAGYIKVADAIRANFSFTPPESCSLPVTVTFNNLSTGAGINSYLWSFGDGGTSTSSGSPPHTYTVGGSYDVKLVVKNSGGCVDSFVVKGAINVGNLKADFAVPARVCLGKPVYITNTSSPSSEITGNLWNLGDGSTSTETNPSVTYNSVGIKTIKLTVSFGACKVSVTKQIQVIDAPLPSFSYSPKGACTPPLKVQFTNTTVGGSVIKWLISDGQTSTLANPVFILKELGFYNVRLIVSNNSGCLDTLVKSKIIYIGPPKINAITNLPYAGCAPWSNNFSLDITTSENIVKYEWDFGDGVTSNLAQPTHNYNATGNFEVSAIITTSSGCTDTIKSSVLLSVKPKAALSASPLLVCPKDKVYFTDMSTGTVTGWLWSFGDGGISESANPVYNYNDTGWFQVQLIAFNGGCGDTVQSVLKYVYVNPPIAKFIDSFNCNNQKQRFFRDRSAFRFDPAGVKYWEWRIDNLPPVVSQDLDFVFADTGVHDVSLFVKDEFCEHLVSKKILVLDELPDFTFIDTGTCITTELAFTAGGAKLHPWNIKKYTWTFGDGRTAVTDTPYVVHTYNFGVTKDVVASLKITDLNDCDRTINKTIQIRLFGPTANFTPHPISACANTKLFFNDSSAYLISNPIKKWVWNFGEGPAVTFAKPPFFKTYSNAGVYEIKLTVVDSLGCIDSIKVPNAVTIYKPQAAFLSEDTLVCINANVKFTNLSSGTRLQANWSFGNGTVSSLFEPTIKYPLAGIYNIKLVITDTIGCMDSVTKAKYIEVADAVAGFTVNDSFTSCPPLLVNFTNTSSGYVTAEWDFGNGNSSNLISPSHTYLTPGVFTAKLKISGNGGCTDEKTKVITIKGPSGDIRYGPLIGCPPLRVNFASTAINTKIYTWDFVDGIVDVSQNPTNSHIYQLPGEYVPKLVLDDGLGCTVSFLGKDTIKIFGATAFIKQLPKVSFCDSVTINFFDSTIANDVVTYYKWDFGDGINAFERNPVHSYKKPGIYTVIFEVRTATGCTSKDTLITPIVVAPTPQLELLQKPPACLPANILFKANWLNSDTSLIVWKWDFGNNQSSLLFSPPAVAYPKAGNYSIKLTGTNIYGCADTVTNILVINDTPKVTAGPASYICKFQPLTLTATGATTYKWDNNTTLSCLGCASPVATPLSQQIYRVVGTDGNGCKSSDTVLVKVKQPGNLKVEPGDTICVGKALQLTATGSEFYKWSPPAGLSSTVIANPVARPSATTKYMIIGTDSLNCFPDTGYVNVVVYPIPKFEIGQETITAPTGTVILLNTTSSADIDYWRWSPPIGLSCVNCPQPLLTVSQPITYVAKVSNAGGCTAQDLLTVVPTCNSDNIFVPNTFSPNGDGQNDVFFPRGKGLAAIKSMRVFNRWGELVFENKDFMLNDANVGWNGTYKGKTLTPDVYVYIMDVLCDNNEVFSIRGNVTLLR